MQRSTKYFCEWAMQSSALLSGLGTAAGPLHGWETGKPAGSDPRESGRTVRNDRLSHKNTRDISARSGRKFLAVWIWMESVAWAAVPGSYCPARCSRPFLPAQDRPRNKSCGGQGELLLNASAPKAPWAPSSENIWESELHAVNGNCTCSLQSDELWGKKRVY